MSWDISIQRFNRVYTSLEQIPNDEQCVPLGSQAEVRELFRKSLAAQIGVTQPGGYFNARLALSSSTWARRNPVRGSHCMSVHRAKLSSPSLPSVGHRVGRPSTSVTGGSLSNPAMPLQALRRGQVTVIKSSGRPNNCSQAVKLFLVILNI